MRSYSVRKQEEQADRESSELAKDILFIVAMVIVGVSFSLVFIG